MQPIVTVHSFNDAYAELAAVSITSLARSTKRDCDIHVFESSLSEGTTAKVLSIQDKYTNARITVHHIPDDAFAEVADERFGKEAWYPLLAPEILGGLDRALVLEPDTLVCRDLSELFDMEMGGSPLAWYGWSSSPQFVWLGKPFYHNAGVMLFDLGAIRGSDAFRLGGLTDTLRGLMVRCAKGHNLHYYAHETYLNHVLDHGALARLRFKYNAFTSFCSLLTVSLHIDFDDLCEAISNPAIIHYLGGKPNTRSADSSLPVLRKWWECHALTPFADTERDAARLKEIVDYRKSMMGPLCSNQNYYSFLLYDDLLEAIDRLKRLSARGARVVFWGAGKWETCFAALARSKGLVPDKICCPLRCGGKLGGVAIEHPDALGPCGAETIAVVAAPEPRAIADARDALLALGIPESRVLPVFEPLSLGGRRMGEMLGAIAGGRGLGTRG